MTIVPTTQDAYLLSAWVEQQHVVTRVGGQHQPVAVAGVRFAFYGRISTADLSGRVVVAGVAA